MRAAKALALVVGLLGLLALPALGSAAEIQKYTMEFIDTVNRPGAQGTMNIRVNRTKGETTVDLTVRGAHPDTVYTIWIVYNELGDPKSPSILRSASVRAGFPREGSPVAPLARLDAAFTSGMGLDPGASFVTDDKGDGRIKVKLDYNLLGGPGTDDPENGPPVGSGDFITQCAPEGPAPDGTCNGSTGLSVPRKPVRTTTAWLRKFIGEFQEAQRATMCANYDPRFDPDRPDVYKPLKKIDARLWQCVNPATVEPDTGLGLPRVHRYAFDHFRLANHPDDLTHGFIGGSEFDHWIDMVGRRGDLVPAALGNDD